MALVLYTMFDPHRQGIRSRERYERDGPYVSHMNKSKVLAAQQLWKGQAETTVSKDLGGGNHIYIIHDAVSESERISYLQQAADTTRMTTPSGISQMYFTRDGSVPSYADVNQPTETLPSHMLTICSTVSDSVSSAVADNPYTVLDNCAEYEFASTAYKGGGISTQSDACAESSKWGCTAMLSFGQTRWIRFSKNNAQGTINIAMPDNSIIVMYGTTFQDKYQYCVNELPDNHPIGTHLLLKMRFRKPYEQRNVRTASSQLPSSRAWMRTEKKASH